MDFVRSFLDCNHHRKNGSSAFWMTSDGIHHKIIHCRLCGLKVTLDRRVVGSEEAAQQLPSHENAKILALTEELTHVRDENARLRAQLANIRIVLS